MEARARRICLLIGVVSSAWLATATAEPPARAECWFPAELEPGVPWPAPAPGEDLPFVCHDLIWEDAEFCGRDGYVNTGAAELNHDCYSDALDFRLFGRQWTMSGPGLSADLDGDGQVFVNDLIIFQQRRWRPACPGTRSGMLPDECEGTVALSFSADPSNIVQQKSIEPGELDSLYVVVAGYSQAAMIEIGVIASRNVEILEHDPSPTMGMSGAMLDFNPSHSYLALSPAGDRTFPDGPAIHSIVVFQVLDAEPASIELAGWPPKLDTSIGIGLPTRLRWCGLAADHSVDFAVVRNAGINGPPPPGVSTCGTILDNPCSGQAPVCDAGGPYFGAVGAAVEFDGSGSYDPDPGGAVVGYYWEFGDGGTYFGSQVSHIYARAGTFWVNLIVVDRSGQCHGCSTTVPITANAPPVCDAGGPYTGIVGAPIAFDGAGSYDPDGTIVSYAWTFGDGATATGVAPTHTYAAPGVYTVSLTVTDDQQASSSCGTPANVNPTAVQFTDIGGTLPAVDRGSLAWGDYDNDGDLDLVVTGYNGSGGTCRLLRNDGGSFADSGASLPGVYGARAASVAWGDYDRDGDLDLLLAGYTNTHSVRLYRNDAGSFALVTTSLPGIDDGAAIWGDYDNDGDLDIAIAGHLGPASTGVARIYRNDAGTFVDIAAGLPGVFYAALAWGDYDNDGDLDLVLAGSTASERLTRLYRNDAGLFVDAGAGLPGLYVGSLAWGDYDADGDLDLLLTGSPGTGGMARVYRNDGGSFTDVGAGLLSLYYSAAAWGDYDNDGDLDIMMTGYDGAAGHTRIYRNGGGTFTDIAAELPGVYQAAAAWGDYDGDGDLDIALSGYDGALRLTRIFSSSGAEPNSPPAAPDGLSASLVDGQLTLSWTAATDPETPAPGLSYNLRIGTSPGGNQVIAAMADAGSGYRRVVQLGNAQQRTSWTVTLPPGLGRYYWSVQALDGAFAGSPFAAEVIFETPVTFTDIAAGLPGAWLSSLAWGDYDSDGDLDFVQSGHIGSAIISRVYRNLGGGTFTDIGAGLTGVLSGASAWGDYDNDGDLDLLLTGYPSPQSISKVYRNDAGAFIDIAAGLPGARDGAVAWGDYDNDGDLDFVLTGTRDQYEDFARVYRNDAGVFTDIAAGLPGVWMSAVAWGDYDGDGDLDLLLAGIANTTLARVYRNDAGTFTDIAAGLPGLRSCGATWGDYDNDGDLDLVLAGTEYSRVYRNDAGAFTDIAAGLPAVTYGSAGWGDYDNDGDLDLLLAGNASGGKIARVYRNDAGAFTDIAAGLPGVTGGAAAWGDYDNDGDLDLLLMGDTGAGYITRVYRSDGAPANSPPTAPGGLAAVPDGLTVTFDWSAATDAQTPASGLSYNLLIGTTPGGCQVMPAMADATTGYRRVVQLGNAQQRTSWTIELPAFGNYFWGVQAIDGAFAGSPFASSSLSVAGAEAVPETPRAYTLGANVPNPFHSTTTVRYELPVAGPVDLAVYDTAGRLIRTLRQEAVSAGRHEVVWDGRNEQGQAQATGIYYLRLEAGGFATSRTMLLLR